MVSSNIDIGEHDDLGRRSKRSIGWVNFPVNSELWKNTKEGGMFVKLVVCDNRENADAFGIAHGSIVIEHLMGGFVGDSLRPQLPESASAINVRDNADGSPNQEDIDALCEAVFSDQKAYDEWYSYHFPSARKEVDGRDTCSRAYLASIVIASTGWSGWSDSLDRYWYCTEDDLSEQGKQLFKQLKQLYKGCDIHLLTFLDT